MLSNADKIQHDNKFWQTVHKELIRQINNIDSKLMVSYRGYNNLTIMGEMARADYNVKIEFCICGTIDVYERIKISVIGREGVIDSIFLNFSDITGERTQVSAGMYPAYWRGCELTPQHYLELAVRIYDYLHLYEQF